MSDHPTDSPNAVSAPDLTPSLVARLRDGDAAAGALLHQIYRESLLRFCWGYLGRIDDAEDAVQEVCCKVLAAQTVPDAFRPWVYKLARNHCLNRLRDRVRRPDRGALPTASRVYDAMTGHLTHLVRDEQAANLAGLVQALPEDQQEVLRLRYVEDLSRTEIAEVLDLSESTVKSRLFEALRRLRDASGTLENS